MRRKANSDRAHSKLAPEHMSTRFRGMAPQFLPAQYPFEVAPATHAASYPPVRGPHDMLSSPLSQKILDYEPPRGFIIPSFAMYDDSSDPYDHMLHFNQTMILNTGNDRLLCKVFPVSLKGPALAWFHKLPRESLYYVCLSVSVLHSVERKHQLAPIHLQAGRRIHPGFHPEIWISRPTN